MMSCRRGRVMVDLGGLALPDTERERIVRPLVGGVIHFGRNHADADQRRAFESTRQEDAWRKQIYRRWAH